METFADKLKKKYKEVSILSEDHKELIKSTITKAVSEGKMRCTVELEPANHFLEREAVKYIKEVLDLGVSVMFVCQIEVSGWS